MGVRLAANAEARTMGMPMVNARLREINKLIAADRIADAELAQLIAVSALLPRRFKPRRCTSVGTRHQRTLCFCTNSKNSPAEASVKGAIIGRVPAWGGFKVPHMVATGLAKLL